MGFQTEVKNSVLMRDLNLSKIFQLIHELGPISRKELAEQTDYSSATISNHVKTLLKQKFVIETEKGFSTGGRKPIYLTVNPEKGYIFTVDIEVTEVKITAFNLKLEVVRKNIISIRDKNKPDQTLNRVFSGLDKMISKSNWTSDGIIGLGIAAPGLINKKMGTLKFAPNLTWREVQLREKFAARYKVPIILENEANAAAIGEKKFAHPEADNLVYVSVNEGIGCGIIFGEELYRGVSGNAGEFGHIIIDRTGPKCHCGNYGCWETLASETYIINQVSALPAQEGELTKAEVYRQVKQGKKEVLSIVKNTGKNLGIGISNIINSLSPELVVVGGGITEIKDYFQEEMRWAIETEVLEVSYGQVRVKFSELGTSAVEYGLANLVFARTLLFSNFINN